MGIGMPISGWFSCSSEVLDPAIRGTRGWSIAQDCTRPPPRFLVTTQFFTKCRWRCDESAFDRAPSAPIPGAPPTIRGAQVMEAVEAGSARCSRGTVAVPSHTHESGQGSASLLRRPIRARRRRGTLPRPPLEEASTNRKRRSRPGLSCRPRCPSGAVSQSSCCSPRTSPAACNALRCSR